MKTRPSSSKNLASSVTSECRMAISFPPPFRLGSQEHIRRACAQPKPCPCFGELWQFPYRIAWKGGKNLSEVLDSVDARILDLIQPAASLSVAEIAERVGLSSRPCWRRVTRLEAE